MLDRSKNKRFKEVFKMTKEQPLILRPYFVIVIMKIMKKTTKKK